uniref:Ion-translocating oxidoreductase complex subunit G n=1 Tax=Candidatus Kentrum sp. DK TaxID=2126562 RepID=A0A450S6J8_9GAMM|nr:MAG: electron transport complex protein RnfG [Candidatus Kentron sp. DK]
MNEDAAQLKKEQPEEEMQSPVGERPSTGVEGQSSSGEARSGGPQSKENKGGAKKGSIKASDGVETEKKDGPPSDAPPMPSIMPMIVVLGLIAMLSGVLVVFVYEYTAPIIAEKERLALEAAVFQVVPGTDAETAKQLSFSLAPADGLVKISEESAQPANLHAVYDSSNTLLGVAMEGAAQGYQDIVHTLFGYDVDKQQIVGMTILRSVDTPGLGDKKTVEKHKHFMENFDALDVSLTEDKSAVAHPIETVKHGSKSKGWQVDAMSGATITSRAIAKGMAETTGELLPLLVKHLPALRSAATQVLPMETAETKGEN